MVTTGETDFLSINCQWIAPDWVRSLKLSGKYSTPSHDPSSKRVPFLQNIANDLTVNSVVDKLAPSSNHKSKQHPKQPELPTKCNYADPANPESVCPLTVSSKYIHALPQKKHTNGTGRSSADRDQQTVRISIFIISVNQHSMGFRKEEKAPDESWLSKLFSVLSTAVCGSAWANAQKCGWRQTSEPAFKAPAFDRHVPSDHFCPEQKALLKTVLSTCRDKPDRRCIRPVQCNLVKINLLSSEVHGTQ